MIVLPKPIPCKMQGDDVCVTALDVVGGRKVSLTVRSESTGAMFHDVPLRLLTVRSSVGVYDLPGEDFVYSVSPMTDDVEWVDLRREDEPCYVFDRNRLALGKGLYHGSLNWPSGDEILHLIECQGRLWLWPTNRVLWGDREGQLLPQWRREWSPTTFVSAITMEPSCDDLLPLHTLALSRYDMWTPEADYIRGRLTHDIDLRVYDPQAPKCDVFYVHPRGSVQMTLIKAWDDVVKLELEREEVEMVVGWSYKVPAGMKYRIRTEGKAIVLVQRGPGPTDVVGGLPSCLGRDPFFVGEVLTRARM